MSSEGDECYLPTHMLEVSIVEDNNTASTDLQELHENVGEDHTYCRLSDDREDHTYCLPNLHNLYDHCVNGTDELKRRVNITKQNTHVMGCKQIIRKLDESELEELKTFIPFIPDVFLESEDDDNEPELVQINRTTSRIRKKRDGIPVVPVTPEELEFYSKLFEDVGVVRYLRIHCTICDCHIGCCPESINVAFRHRVLGVLVCKQCYVFYGEGNFPQGDDESEIYCRWCGQGGRLLCCSSCPCTFCKRCLMRNFTKKSKLEFENRIDWECFVCNPRYIWEHRAFCWAVIKYIQKENEDWKCGIESGGVIYGPKTPASGDDPSVCCEGIHENSKATSHRRISVGLPEEERMKMFVQAAIRLRNLDRNYEKNLVSQLDSEMWNVVNHVPRIKPRDISELTEKQSNTEKELLSPILNPISVVNSTNVTSANVCSSLPPMVQIPTNSLPAYHIVSGQQEIAPQILPLINPCNPINSPRSSATDSAPFSQYIVKAITTTSNNVVRLPVVTNSQVDGTKVNYYPNPMAVIPNSQPSSYSSQFLTSLSQGAGVFVRGLQGTNPRPLTKIAIVNGQAVPNRPGFFYINAAQKRFVAPVLQPLKRVLRLPAVPQNGPTLNSQPLSAASIPASNNNNNNTVTTNHHTDTEDDDICIISSTPPASKSERHNILQLSKAANIVPLCEKVNSSPQNEIKELASSDKPQNEKNPLSGQGNCLSDIISQGTDSLQLNSASSNKSFCRQLKRSLEEIDEISRNMSTCTVLMRKMYKRLVKQGDFTGLETVAKRLRRLLKKNIQKMSVVDSRVLTEFEAFIKMKTSAEIGENPSRNCTISTVDLDSASDQEDDVLSALEKDVHIDWNSSDSDDNSTVAKNKIAGKKNVSVNVLASKSFETEKITLNSLLESSYSRHQTKSPSKGNSLLKRSLLKDRYIPELETESPHKDKICSSYLGNVEAAEDNKNSEGSPIKCPLSPSELKKSMSCTVPLKLDISDAEKNTKKRKRTYKDLPSSKRRNSQARANIFKETFVPIEGSNDIHNIPVEWTKLIRPCSVVLVKIDNCLLRKQESKTV